MQCFIVLITFSTDKGVIINKVPVAFHESQQTNNDLLHDLDHGLLHASIEDCSDPRFRIQIYSFLDYNESPFK